MYPEFARVKDLICTVQYELHKIFSIAREVDWVGGNIGIWNNYYYKKFFFNTDLGEG